MVRREKTNYVIQSVSHALDVLEQFSGDAEELGVTELSKRLKLHKNNVFRLLATLESRGYIEQNKATENYRLGIRCLQLGQTFVQPHGPAPPGAAGHGRALVKSAARAPTSPCCAAAAWCRSTAVEADQPVRMVSRIGEALPLHCTAAGKVHLAFESEEELKSALPETLERYTEKTIIKRTELIAAAARRRRERLRDRDRRVPRGRAVDRGADPGLHAHRRRQPRRQRPRVSAVAGAHRERGRAARRARPGSELSTRLGFNGVTHRARTRDRARLRSTLATPCSCALAERRLPKPLDREYYLPC